MAPCRVFLCRIPTAPEGGVRERMTYMTRTGKRAAVLGLALLLTLLCGCGEKVSVQADLSGYGDSPITIRGLKDQDFTVTPGELAKLDCVKRTATGATAKAGTVNAVGPLLNTFLARYGVRMSDFKKIRFLCSDGYRIVLRDEYLKDYEVMLELAEEDAPLPKKQQPLRILIPEAESSYWAYAVTTIEFVK